MSLRSEKLEFDIQSMGVSYEQKLEDLHEKINQLVIQQLCSFSLSFLTFMEKVQYKCLHVALYIYLSLALLSISGIQS